MEVKECIKCGIQIDTTKTRSVKYCSTRCSKLWLKAEWKKRTHEHQLAYQREYRRAKAGGNRPHTEAYKLRENYCLRCGTTEDLQLAHIKPLRLGGTHRHVITFCRTHHMQYDNTLKDFWYTPTRNQA